MIKIKVPFLLGHYFYEKDVEFVFKIATLETATNDILNCELWEADTKDQTEVNVAVLYAAYLEAQRRKFKKPKYKLTQAAYWLAYMNEESKKVFYKELNELFGKLSGGKGKEKKK